MSRHLGSRGIRAPRKLWMVLLLIVLLGSLTPPALADHFPEEGPNVTADPSTGLDPEGQTITVQGSGFSGSENFVQVFQCSGPIDPTCVEIGSADIVEGFFTAVVDVQYAFAEGQNCDDPDCFVRATAVTEGGPEGDDASISFATDGQDSCVVGEGEEEGCTATTDNGVTGPDNPISVTMTVPAGQPAGVYTIQEIEDPVANSKGAAEYTGPEEADSIFITVSCDESQCKKKKLAILDRIIFVIKGNPDGSQQILLPCDLTIRIGRKVFHITNPPPCLVSVVRNAPNAEVNPGDLVWTVEVRGGDPTIKGRG